MKKNYLFFVTEERVFLDFLYIIGLVGYVIGQFAITGGIHDGIFLLLLTSSTFFLNHRQNNLYLILSSSDPAKLLFDAIGEYREYQAKMIFLNPAQRIAAVGFASIVALIVWHFSVWNSNLLNALFCAYLFTANIPTGFAIIRLIRYFYYNNRWIRRLKIDSDFELHVNFLKKLCFNVLFTAVIYCTTSLSSILFTRIKVNYIVELYAAFAICLILISLISTNMGIYKKKEERIVEKINAIENKMNKYVDDVLDNDDMDLVVRIKNLQELKSIVREESKSIFDLSKLISGICLICITILPIILQWILDRL